MLVIVIIFLSFCIDGLFSNLVFYSDYFYPLFSLLSLVIVYPYYKKRDFLKYLFSSICIGLLYDLVYTNTLFLNMILFSLVPIFVSYFYNLLKVNFSSSLCISFFLIIFYRVLTYLILLLVGYVYFDINNLLSSIYHSLVINFVYIAIVYYFTKYVSKKFLIFRRK